jgi:DNA-nicking Smr family endonuclease
MTRKARPEETRLWALVAATVHPLPGRRVVVEKTVEPEPPSKASALKPYVAAAHQTQKRPAPKGPPGDIEPGRKRRLTRERDHLEFRLDLHGFNQDGARAALHRFLLNAQADGARAGLVITGKGYPGEGVLRRVAPDWLADPALRGVVAGVSEAHRRHGGEGALYVALKRRS